MFRQRRLRKRCQVLARQCMQASLESYIEDCVEQDVDKLVNTPLISVDLELTGLEPLGKMFPTLMEHVPNLGRRSSEPQWDML